MLKIILIAFSFVILNAHQIVAKKVDNAFEIGFWAHDKFIGYDKRSLIGVKAYNQQAKPIKTGVDYKNEVPKVLPIESPYIISSVFDAGYWSDTQSSGYINKAVNDVNEIVFDTLKSIKIGKTIFKWSENFTNPLGLKLEVTPLFDPLKLKVGDELIVLVTKDGKALKNASFEDKMGDIDVKSNNFGIAYLPIKEKGMQIFAVIYNENLVDDLQAQRLTLQSSLSFEVK